MDQFLERHNLPELIQEDIDKMKRPISIKEFESMLNKLSKQKAPSSDSLLKGSTKHVRKQLYLLAIISSRGNTYLFCEVSIALIPRPDKENYLL